MFQLGQRVEAGGHGPGTITEVRTPTGIDHAAYLMSDRGKEIRNQLPAELLVGSFYGPDRYPYKINFDDGYSDVYAEREIALCST